MLQLTDNRRDEWNSLLGRFGLFLFIYLCETGSAAMTQPSTPFDTIESAQDFVRVLAEAIAEAQQEMNVDLERELQFPPSRRSRALQIATYNLDKLEKQMLRSRRILNDLRSLRRLLFAEREFHRVKGMSDEARAAAQPDFTPPLIAAIPAPKKPGVAGIVTNPTRPQQAISA